MDRGTWQTTVHGVTKSQTPVGQESCLTLCDCWHGWANFLLEPERKYFMLFKSYVSVRPFSPVAAAQK